MNSIMQNKQPIEYKKITNLTHSPILIAMEGEIEILRNKKISKKQIKHYQRYKTLSLEEAHLIFVSNNQPHPKNIEYRIKQSMHIPSPAKFKEEEDFIKSCKFSKGIKQEDIRTAMSSGKIFKFHIGQSVFLKGDKIDGFFVIKRGNFVLKKYILLSCMSYKKIDVSQIGQGQIIGYAEIIDGSDSRQNDLICNSADAEVWFFQKQDLGMFKNNLINIHEKRKRMNKILQKKRLQTLESALPYLSRMSKQKDLLKMSSAKRLIRKHNHSFAKRQQTQEESFFQNNYSKPSNFDKSTEKIPISNKKPKSKYRLRSYDLNEYSQIPALKTICQTLPNQIIDKKHQRFVKFRRQNTESREFQIKTPFKDQAKAFKLTYEQQKLKQICQGRCKRNCRRRYL